MAQVSIDIYISKEFSHSAGHVTPEWRVPRDLQNSSAVADCAEPFTLVLEVLLVLLHGLDQVPPLEHLVEEHH